MDEKPDKYRMDSTTDVEDGDIDVLKESDDEDGDEETHERWRSSPTQDDGRLGPRAFGNKDWEMRSRRSGQVSHVDEPYRKTPSRTSRHTKSASGLAFQDTPYGRPWRSGDPYRYNSLTEEKNPWLKTRKLVHKYDESMCAAWKEEVDKLLIFAGLFSATITAFAVESYKWLREEPEDMTVKLLAYLAAQAAPGGVLPPDLGFELHSVSRTEERINALWFISLAFSVTTVLIGILCLQWLREYERDAALPFKDSIALRQMRFEGLVAWRVPEILSFLPLLLQISLVSFFFGLLDLLWTHNQPVAACLTVVLGIVLLLVMFTVIAPTLQQILVSDDHLRVAQCPYKSPQSWIFYRIFNTAFVGTMKLLGLPWKSTSERSRFYRLFKGASDTSWLAFDMRWRNLRDAAVVVRGVPRDVKDGEDLHGALHWLNGTFTVQNPEAVHPLHACLTSEQLSITTAEQAISRMYLDLGQMDAATFRVMLDDRYSPGEAQKRDIVSAFYLHLHYRGQDGSSGEGAEGGGSHVVGLRNAYIETVVRILNTQDVPRPFYDWLTEILIELCGRVVVNVDVGDVAVVGGLPTTRMGLRSSGDYRLRTRMRSATKKRALGDGDEEIVVQVLMCVQGLIAKDALRVLDVVMAWNLIYYVLYEFSELPVVPAPLTPAAHRQREFLPLVLGIVDALVGWVESGKERDRWERVKLCAEGVLKVFPPAILEAYLTVPKPTVHRATPSSLRSGVLPYDVGPAQPGGGESVQTTRFVDGLAIRESLVVEDEEALAEEGIKHVVRLVRVLDAHVNRMGGPGAVLLREKWWHEFWDSGFKEDDWKAVTEVVG